MLSNNSKDKREDRFLTRRCPARARPGVRFLLLLGLAGVAALTGCRTAPGRSPSLNLSEPGWSVREGQGIWRARSEVPDFAGEVIFASHTDGRSFVQFTKNPLPLLTAQCSRDHWEIEFIPEKRHYAGRGLPPVQLIWLHLARALAGLPVPKPLQFEAASDGGQHLENPKTGESLIIYFTSSNAPPRTASP